MIRTSAIEEPIAAAPLNGAKLRDLQSRLRERRVLLFYGQPLDDAQLLDLLRGLARTLVAAGGAASVLYAQAAPRAGSDAVWMRLARACDLLDAGTKREVGELQLTVYNPFLRRLGCRPGRG